MENQQPNRPAATLTDGPLRAAIWRNQGKGGTAYYSVTLSRIYKDDDGKFHEAHSFAGADLLRLSKMLSTAYEECAARREQDTPGIGRSEAQI